MDKELAYTGAMLDLDVSAGRWKLEDIAEDQNGILWRVIGIITDPAVIFKEIGGHRTMTQVAGCRNEIDELKQYTEVGG